MAVYSHCNCTQMGTVMPQRVTNVWFFKCVFKVFILYINYDENLARIILYTTIPMLVKLQLHVY